MAECKEGEHVVFVYIGLTKYREFQERFGWYQETIIFVYAQR